MLEVLAPAGTMEKLKTAIYFGADAVYIAGNKFGLRAFAGNFSNEEIIEAVEFVHSKNKKLYVTINILARDRDFAELKEFADFLFNAKVDAVIVSDLGVFAFIKENQPDLEIHVSTQANVLNSYSANYFVKLGAKRIVLARELSLDEIKTIRNNLPSNIELESFVHGAMCISYSGRCLLSNYLCNRDSNRGECVQACRWEYFISEKKRPEDLYPILEDERGTYILNSKDLKMLSNLKQLIDAGVTSFKIEGRMKSAYYVATTVNAYRRAVDAILKNCEIDKCLEEELEKTSHRRYTTGFYMEDKEREFLETSNPIQSYDFVAVVTSNAKDGFVEVEQRNKFVLGDEVEILSPNDCFNKTFVISDIINDKNEHLTEAIGVQQRVLIPTPFDLCEGDILRKKSKNYVL